MQWRLDLRQIAQEFGSIISREKKDKRPCVKNAALLLSVKVALLMVAIRTNEANTRTTR